jgi:uroporphyrinogen III methyltransferase / synthase
MDKPLTGRTIVITRAASQAGDFVTALERYGAAVLSCPLIEIRELSHFERLDEAIEHLYGYDWLIFTSTNSVEFFLKRMETKGHAVSDLDEVKVCAIGEATATRLTEKQIHVDLVPGESKAEGVFSALSEFVGGVDNLATLNILFPRAAVARDYLPKSLEEAGARVDLVPTYQTVVPENLDRGRLTAMLAGSADCIAFTSSSSVRNLATLFDTPDLSMVLQDIDVACIGDVTSETAIEFGLKVSIQPKEFNTEKLAEAIASYYERQS